MESSKQTHFLLFFFSIDLILFSIELKNTPDGYKTKSKEINHQFYMDDLKFYANNGDDDL